MKKLYNDIGLLVLRLTAGLSMLLAHGIPKLSKVDGFTANLANSGFPLPKVNAYLAVSAETIFPLLIILGIFTRVASAIAAFNMFVAAIVFHIIIKGDDFGGYEKALLYFFIFLALAITGSGRFSVDKLFK